MVMVNAMFVLKRKAKLLLASGDAFASGQLGGGVARSRLKSKCVLVKCLLFKLLEATSTEGLRLSFTRQTRNLGF